MKKFGKYLLWILGIFTWLNVLFIFWEADTTNGTSVHKYILIITGICLAIYIWRKTGSGTEALEQRVRELEAENQKLRQQMDQEFVQSIIDKTENK